MSYEIELINGGTGESVTLQVERVDIKYNREVFEYKRKEARRVNDRGFISTVFVITGWYKGESEQEAADFQATIRDIMKTWYRSSDLHRLIWSCGDGNTYVNGKAAWKVAIKSGDATQRSDYPDQIDWVITLMEGQ